MEWTCDKCGGTRRHGAYCITCYQSLKDALDKEKQRVKELEVQVAYERERAKNNTMMDAYELLEVSYEARFGAIIIHHLIDQLTTAVAARDAANRQIRDAKEHIQSHTWGPYSMEGLLTILTSPAAECSGCKASEKRIDGLYSWYNGLLASEKRCSLREMSDELFAALQPPPDEQPNWFEDLDKMDAPLVNDEQPARERRLEDNCATDCIVIHSPTCPHAAALGEIEDVE